MSQWQHLMLIGHTLQMKPASEFFSSLMVMEMYEDLTTRLDAHNVKLNLLQSSILELTKVVKLLVASEVKKNPTGYGDDNKTTMYEEDDVSFFLFVSSYFRYQASFSYITSSHHNHSTCSYNFITSLWYNTLWDFINICPSVRWILWISSIYLITT